MFERWFGKKEKRDPKESRIGDLSATGTEVRQALRNLIDAKPQARDVLQAYLDRERTAGYVQMNMDGELYDGALLSAQEMHREAQGRFDSLMQDPNNTTILERIRSERNKMRDAAERAGNDDPDDLAVKTIGSALAGE